MIRSLFNLLAIAALLGLASRWVLSQLHAPPGSDFIVLGCLGVACYLVGDALTRHYLGRRARELGVVTLPPQLAERHRVVPRWVGGFQALGLAFCLALPTPIVLWLIGRR